MAEESMIDLQQVLLEGLPDEMYPTYHFFKKRLLSIYPRFKKEIEELFELVPDGKQFIPGQDKAVYALKKTVRLILIGNYEEVISEERDTWKSIIASSRCSFPDTVKLKKCPDFKLDVKNISTRPEVIVYVVDDTKQTFSAVTNHMLKIIPKEGQRSFIVCSESLGKYITLQDVEAATGDCQSVSSKVHKTLGSRIQACLEEKVVTVLQRMLDYIHEVISPEAFVEVSEIKREELFKHAVSETLQEASDEIQGVSDIYSPDRVERIEEQTRESLSLIYGKEENLMRMMFVFEVLAASIKRKCVNINNTFQGAIKRSKYDLDQYIVEDINGSLRAYEIKSRKIFENLSMIDFEIKGVFRQAEYAVSPSPDISRSVQKKILSISGVNGCGVMLGKLVVHMKEDSSADEETITRKVEKILKSNESQSFVNCLEVKKVRVSTTAGGTFESGQRLCVNGSFSQANRETYGTLGCFVKGRKDNGSSEQLYALSCAHVFPDGCNSVVKVAHAQSEDLEILGHISDTFKLLREHKIDIAAIAVTPEAKQKCLHSLKNSDNCDVWQSVLHEGDFNAILGFQVYKWGAVSNITRGLIIAVNYDSQGFDSQFNIFIKNDPESSEVFSSEGDSGSVVCFDKPSDETVKILSLVNGEITAAGKHECSYSVHLKKNLEELSTKSGHSFQLYNPF